MVWDPEQYVHGNYFQNETSEEFRKNFIVKPSGTILDIGCGDGQYSSLLANHLKKGHILGIDSSPDMIRHANEHWASDSLSFEVHNIEEYHQSEVFDFILSFWCLHWTNIELSLPNIFDALKNGGRVYALLSSLSDNSILQACRELAEKNCYRDLSERYTNPDNTREHFFYRVFKVVNKLPFKQIKLNLKTTRVYFPDINYFKSLLLTMPFIKSFSPENHDALIEDLVLVFKNICQRKYGGNLYYETRPIYLEAIK